MPNSDSSHFDIGIDARLPLSQLTILGFQNVFGMTGMFVFPGLLGRSFSLPPEQIAYVYGMTFISCGIVTILQSVLLLRLPIVQGPYAGSLAALLTVGHASPGGLGAAYGSFFVASVIWCLLSVPIKGRSIVGLLERYLRFPMISGMIVMLIMVQIAGVALPNWIGSPEPGGSLRTNFVAGLVAIAAIIGVMLLGRPWMRRIAILVGLAVGTICYVILEPVSFAAVASAPIVVVPHWFPYGFSVEPAFVVIFLLVLIPAGLGSMALYQTVAEWGGQRLSSARMSEGLFGSAIGAVVASILGGFSTIVYPDNIGMLRATRVLSRYGTLAGGLILILLGSNVKFDMLLVVVPLSVISAVATLLYGIVFMHGVHMLSEENWSEKHLLVAGLSFFIGLGGLFVAPNVMEQLPLLLRLILQQPVVSGGITLIVLYTLLCRPRNDRGDKAYILSTRADDA
jgi:xanthine/uracil permease